MSCETSRSCYASAVAQGNTALAIAAQDGHLNAVKELLSRGADFNGKQVRLDRLHNEIVPACMTFTQEVIDIARLLWHLAACSCHGQSCTFVLGIVQLHSAMLHKSAFAYTFGFTSPTSL